MEGDRPPSATLPLSNACLQHRFPQIGPISASAALCSMVQPCVQWCQGRVSRLLWVPARETSSHDCTLCRIRTCHLLTEQRASLVSYSFLGTKPPLLLREQHSREEQEECPSSLQSGQVHRFMTPHMQNSGVLLLVQTRWFRWHPQLDRRSANWQCQTPEHLPGHCLCQSLEHGGAHWMGGTLCTWVPVNTNRLNLGKLVTWNSNCVTAVPGNSSSSVSPTEMSMASKSCLDGSLPQSLGPLPKASNTLAGGTQPVVAWDRRNLFRTQFRTHAGPACTDSNPGTTDMVSTSLMSPLTTWRAGFNFRVQVLRF